MPLTEHPASTAFTLLTQHFNRIDTAYFRAKGQPVSHGECAAAALRMAKYANHLPADLAAALADEAEQALGTIRDSHGRVPEVVKGSGNTMVLHFVNPSNKDSAKAVAEAVTGKRCLLWNTPEHPGCWAVHKKFVAQLVSSGYFMTRLSEDDYAWNEPAKPAVTVPTIDWNVLQPKREARHFQKEGVEFIVPAIAEPGKGAILADDQGLGKTLQALTTAYAYGERLVVICPAGVRYNWANEVFLTHPTWTVCVYNDKATFRSLKASFGTNAVRISHYPNKADVVIMSYESTKMLVCGNSDPITSRYNTMKMVVMPHLVELFKDRIIVCDEAHYAKNVDAKRAQSTLALCRASLRVICMTGTPICNRPAELWTLLCATGRNREVAGSAADFKASYCNRTDNLSELNRRLVEGRFFLRRLKKDVLHDLPPKQRQDFIVQMSPRQQLEYESLRQGLKTQVKSGGMAKNGTCILALLTNMQTLANAAKVAPVAESLIERAEEGYFTVVQCTRVEPLKEIQAELHSHGVTAEMLYGGSSDSDRKRICTEFADGKIQVVLTTLAEGINLQKADKCILLDLDWSPAKISQREDRIHRIGQTEHVTIQRVLAASIDHHKKDVVASKQEIIDQVVDGGDSAHADDRLMEEVIRRLVDED